MGSAKHDFTEKRHKTDPHGATQITDIHLTFLNGKYAHSDDDECSMMTENTHKVYCVEPVL